MNLSTFLTFFSGFSFLFFGAASLFTSQMKSEFKRYGLESSRTLVGGIQLLGALGLLLGYLYSPLLQIVAASGLSILMVLGFLVRLRIRDSFIQSAPSLIYAVLNAILFIMLLDVL
ncbi:MAG: DoxX family protein [Maribacter sp.]|uniref:DoxX family protein n=1 Tax=Maribacter sp. TaxID=1897614 RepID=UPI003C723CD6